MQKLDRRMVAGAGRALAKRVIGGAFAGWAIGLAAFGGEKAAGWLGASAMSWVLLPLYAVAGAIAGAYIGWVLGKRRAATMLLIDSGLVRELAGRAVAGASPDVEAGASTLVRWAKQLATKMIALAMPLAGATGDPVATVTERVCDAIRGWGRVRVILAAVALIVVLVLVPATER